MEERELIFELGKIHSDIHRLKEDVKILLNGQNCDPNSICSIDIKFSTIEKKLENMSKIEIK